MKLSIVRLSVVVCLWWLFSVSADAQVSATLSGRVTDVTGDVIPAATVTAIDVDTGVSRTVVATSVGLYELVALPVGRYEIHATKQGFAEQIRTGEIVDVAFLAQRG